MSSPQLLLPLRIPELGPHLGKLIVGTGRSPGGFQLDAMRHRLVSRVLNAAGEARRLAARGERASAVAALNREVWLESWEEAVSGVAETLMEVVDRHLAAEAQAVKMPRRLRARVALGAAEKRALTARLGSAGAGLVPVLDELERRGAAALVATARERDAVAAWQAGLTAAARRLEAAWIALEDAVETQVRQWLRVADDISRWRKPLWPVLVVGSFALAGATWLGLVFGGYVTAPLWLRGVWSAIVGP